MGRLIDADALTIDRIETEMASNEMRLYISKNQIDNAPTVDAVEVVRCGECIHNKSCTWSEPDWFCADGEVRDDDI